MVLETVLSTSSRPYPRGNQPSTRQSAEADPAGGPIFCNAFGLPYSFCVVCPESPAIGVKMEVLIQASQGAEKSTLRGS
jgi:hypothetical protein